jgi:rhodanese-related sulfurtransferase
LNRRAFLTWLVVAGLAPAAAAQAPDEPGSLSAAQARAGVVAGRLLLVDIRGPREWADTGIAEGAIALDMMTGAFEARLAALRAENPGRPIVFIDRVGERARTLRTTLAARGWRDLQVVRGGMLGDGRNPGWLAEKLPLRR